MAQQYIPPLLMPETQSSGTYFARFSIILFHLNSTKNNAKWFILSAKIYIFFIIGKKTSFFFQKITDTKEFLDKNKLNIICIYCADNST